MNANAAGNGVWRQDVEAIEAARVQGTYGTDAARSGYIFRRARLREKSRGELAYALFSLDPRVVAFVLRVAEGADGERAAHVRRIAWERNEGGWAFDARARAERIDEALRALSVSAEMPYFGEGP